MPIALPLHPSSSLDTLLQRRSVASTLTPSDTQLVTLYFIGGYIIFITIAWSAELLIYFFGLLTLEDDVSYLKFITRYRPTGTYGDLGI